MLIISLPHNPKDAQSGFAHVHSDGHQVQRNAVGAASLLSTYAGEVVAVVPRTRLSWLSVQFPPGSHGARLGAVLEGLLEDRVLEDVSPPLSSVSSSSCNAAQSCKTPPNAR